jgi:hypothetical protein
MLEAAVRRFRYWATRLLFIISILGPGFITANVDNDSGGIYTYASAGAQFGHSLLWTMIPVAVALTFAQEIAARMGVVTGKGLSELIREEYGFRITFFVMAALVVCNFCDVLSEFAGVASSMQPFGVSKYISVPIAAILVWCLVVFGDYKKIEKIFLFLSFLYIAYIVTAIFAKPDWVLLGREMVRIPSLREMKDPGLSLPVRWHHRRDHRSLAAVLSAGFGRRQGKQPHRAQICAGRRDCGITLFRTDRWIHRGRLRRHAVYPRPVPDTRCRRRSPVAPTFGRGLCVHSVFRGIAERIAVRGFDPAAFNGIHRV